MKYIQDKEWNLEIERPKVLFLGNGLFYSDSNWDNFIERNKRQDISLKEWGAIENAPYTIRATAALPTNDLERQQGYLKEIDKIHSEMQKGRPHILELLDLPFDAILTTNYTYQIESHIKNDYCELSNEQKAKKYAKQTFVYNKKFPQDSKFLLRTFNRLEYNGKNQNIWHIHGEARRKSSIVATHDEYGKLMEAIRQYCKKYGANYRNFYNSFRFNSWIDYLIMGDVYFIGSQLDYTEFDLWWLFSRRMREEKNHGKMIYYSPSEQNPERETIFKLLDIEIRTLNCYKTASCDFDSFYVKAIENIKKDFKK